MREREVEKTLERDLGEDQGEVIAFLRKLGLIAHMQGYVSVRSSFLLG
jgi:hypothetical protein